jgi:hypothetical protein
MQTVETRRERSQRRCFPPLRTEKRHTSEAGHPGMVIWIQYYADFGKRTVATMDVCPFVS